MPLVVTLKFCPVAIVFSATEKFVPLTSVMVPPVAPVLPSAAISSELAENVADCPAPAAKPSDKIGVMMVPPVCVILPVVAFSVSAELSMLAFREMAFPEEFEPVSDIAPRFPFVPVIPICPALLTVRFCPAEVKFNDSGLLLLLKLTVLPLVLDRLSDDTLFAVVVKAATAVAPVRSIATLPDEALIIPAAVWVMALPELALACRVILGAVNAALIAIVFPFMMMVLLAPVTAALMLTAPEVLLRETVSAPLALMPPLASAPPVVMVRLLEPSVMLFVEPPL